MFEEKKLQESNNYMDRWILSFTQSLLLFVKQEMDGKNIFVRCFAFTLLFAINNMLKLNVQLWSLILSKTITT